MLFDKRVWDKDCNASLYLLCDGEEHLDLFFDGVGSTLTLSASGVRNLRLALTDYERRKKKKKEEEEENGLG